MGVTLIATPAGYDYRNALSRQVDIRLVPQGIVLPQAVLAGGALHALADRARRGPGRHLRRHRASIAVVRAGSRRIRTTRRSARQAGGAITSYQWDFGNGQTGQRRRVTTARFPTRGTLRRQADRHERSRPEQHGHADGDGGGRRQSDGELRRCRRMRRASTSRCSSTPTRRRPRLAGRSPATTGTSATAASAAASPSRTASRAPVPSRSR